MDVKVPQWMRGPMCFAHRPDRAVVQDAHPPLAGGGSGEPQNRHPKVSPVAESAYTEYERELETEGRP